LATGQDVPASTGRKSWFDRYRGLATAHRTAASRADWSSIGRPQVSRGTSPRRPSITWWGPSSTGRIAWNDSARSSSAVEPAEPVFHVGQLWAASCPARVRWRFRTGPSPIGDGPWRSKDQVGRCVLAPRSTIRRRSLRVSWWRAAAPRNQPETQRTAIPSGAWRALFERFPPRSETPADSPRPATERVVLSTCDHEQAPFNPLWDGGR
jgi:hypothetical protein